MFAGGQAKLIVLAGCVGVICLPALFYEHSGPDFSLNIERQVASVYADLASLDPAARPDSKAPGARITLERTPQQLKFSLPAANGSQASIVFSLIGDDERQSTLISAFISIPEDTAADANAGATVSERHVEQLLETRLRAYANALSTNAKPAVQLEGIRALMDALSTATNPPL